MARRTTLYRYLTGPDDAAFCHRISDALAKGWQLYGNPTLAFDEKAGRVICGQAITRAFLRKVGTGFLSEECSICMI